MTESSSAAETTIMVSGLRFRGSATTHGIPWRQGFTLAELLVSVAVSGLVIVSLGSALTIATRSIRPDASSAVTLDAARCLRTLQEDLRFATRILDHSATSIRVLTTDANRNGSADLVLYSWSGVSGDDLTRSVDGGIAIPVCEDVTDFNLSLATRNDTQAVPAPPVGGSEILLDQYTSTSGTTDVSVGYTDAYAQYVHPETFLSTALLGSSDEWQITRVDYYASKATSDDDSTYEFEIDKATADGLSTHDELYSVTLDPDDASGSGSWLSVSMDSLPWLDATQGVSLKFTWRWGWNRLTLLETASGSGDGSQTTYSNSTDWLRPATNRSLLFKVYGKIRSKTHQDQQEPARRFQMADIRLAAASLTDGPLYGAAEFLNRPLDATLLADTDFSTYSITDDSNRDSLADWSLINTSSSNSSAVASGKWTATNKAIRLTPTIAAGQQVDLRVHCRDTTSSSGSVLARAAVSQLTGGQSVSAMAYLTLQSDGTQELAIYEETGTNTFSLLAQYHTLASTQQELRLVLNPQHQSLAVWVNGVFIQSLSIKPLVAASLPSTVQIQAYGNSCEFDSCNVLTRSVTTTETVLP